MKPMLAHKYSQHKKKLVWPAFTQPKIDGVRALYNSGRLQSRDGKFWHRDVCAHICKALSDLPPHITLDGELYKHTWRLQEINSCVAVNRNEPAPLTYLIEYHVFDHFDETRPELAFIDRHERLCAIIDHICNPLIRLVPTYQVSNEIEFESFFAQFRSLKYEGSMWRASLSPYGLPSNCGNKENRWHCLLKRKDWLDDWFPVHSFNYGLGRLSSTVGTIVCLAPNGSPFEVGSGFSDADREHFLTNLPNSLHVQYETLSRDGIPLKPVFLEAK
jgi:DNA ligase-1